MSSLPTRSRVSRSVAWSLEKSCRGAKEKEIRCESVSVSVSGRTIETWGSAAHRLCHLRLLLLLSCSTP